MLPVEGTFLYFIVSNDFQNESEKTHLNPGTANLGPNTDFGQNSATANSSAEIN